MGDTKLVDFDQDTIPPPLEPISPPPKPIPSKYTSLRQGRIDPVGLFEVGTHGFEFKYKWDPYTGERLNDLDPNGPLVFHPDILIKTFYSNRLNKLWVD